MSEIDLKNMNAQQLKALIARAAKAKRALAATAGRATPTKRKAATPAPPRDTAAKVPLRSGQVDGFTVFASPIKPKHLSAEEIRKALAGVKRG